MFEALKKMMHTRKQYHSYTDFNLMSAYAEYLEAKQEEELTKRLRTTKVKMTVMQPNAEDQDNFVVFFQIQGYREFKKMLSKADSVMILDHPPPKQKTKLKQGEKPERDDLRGWVAYLKTDEYVLQRDSRADIVAFTSRPNNDEHPMHAMQMMNGESDDDFGTHFVYLQIKFSVWNVKNKIKAVDALRYKNSKGDAEAERLRKIFVGRNLTGTTTTDLLDGLDEKNIKALTKGTTASQTGFLTNYCRSLVHNFGLLVGPFGAGKTTVIKLVAEALHMKKAKGQERQRTIVVSTANAPADRVIEKATEAKDLNVLRLHALGLEKVTMMKDARKDVPRGKLLPPDPEPVVPEGETDMPPKVTEQAVDHEALFTAQSTASEPASDDDCDAQSSSSVGYRDDAAWKSDETILRAYEGIYKNRFQIMSSNDPRMVLLEQALWTKMLHFTGIIPGRQESELIPWATFQRIVPEEQETVFNAAILASAREVVLNADLVVCTIAQLGSDLLKEMKWDLAIINEASVPIVCECVQVAQKAAKVLMVEDPNQLGPVVLSTKENNDFKHSLEQSLFKRLIACGFPYHTLKETMRATAGLKEPPNDLFYGGKLVDGSGTSLEDRPRTVKWLDFMHSTYPTLKISLTGLAYPSNSHKEIGGGTSRWNPSNIACAVDHIRGIIKAEVFAEEDIGIITPYSAQVEAYVDILRMVQLPHVKFGTVEAWQGHEKRYMIGDLVRAQNDGGDTGFASDPKRLAVLISRHCDGFTLIGNKFSTRPLTLDKEPVSKEVDEAW
ncbi:MAG: hypothetical protein Q9218_007551, partial [Villophora microphyllina]